MKQEPVLASKPLTSITKVLDYVSVNHLSLSQKMEHLMVKLLF